MKASWVVLVATLWLAGCAALKGGPADPAAQAGEAPGAGTSLEVIAPDPLKALLERYLDLARVGTLSRGDVIDEAEWTRLIDAAPAQARELLGTEGFFDPVVTLTRESTPDAAQRHVTLKVEPGVRTRVSRVTIEVEGELERAAGADDGHAKSTLAALRGGWAMPSGTPFRNPAWNDAKAAALARLRAAGYAQAAWNGTGAEVDAERHEARLFLVAESGPLFRFGELKIEGLVRHDPQTVRNLANFAPGTPVTETLLLDYQERLQKADLFDGVSVTLEADPEHAERSTIAVRLREAPLQVYIVGLGISANVGPRASLEHVHRRVFGWSATARNNFEWGQLRQSWQGEIATHPNEHLYRNLLGAAISREKTDADEVLSQRVRLGRTRDTQRLERLYFVEAERSSRSTATAKSDTLALSLNQHAVVRRIDSVLLPTRGWTASLQGSIGRSTGSDSESGPFSRLYGRLTGYLPIGENWFGQARIELGQVFKSDAVAVPDPQLFRAGGDNSVRGYDYRSLGPIVDGAVAGGNSLVTLSVEMARPISAALPSIWGAVFVDAGSAANSFGDMKLAFGPGIGVRWRSPVGPLRLDWAYGTEVKAGRFHFSVGIAF